MISRIRKFFTVSLVNFYDRIRAINEILKETQGEPELQSFSKNGHISYHCSCGQGEDVPVDNIKTNNILWKCPKMGCTGKITIVARKPSHVQKNVS